MTRSLKEIRNFLKHPLFSGSFVMLGGSMLVNLINYLYHLLMGRVLGPVDYGTLLSLYSLMYLISIIPMSTSVAIVKFVSKAKSKKEVSEVYSGVKNLMLYIAMTCSSVLVLFSPLISGFLKIQEVLAVILVAPVMFFSLITLVNQATSQGLLKFYGMVGPNLMSSLLKLILGILFVFVGLGVSGAVGGVVMGMIATYFYSERIVRKFVVASVAKKFDLKPFLKYALPALLQALAFTSFFSVDVLLAKHYLSPVDAGFYSSLSTLGKIIYFAASPISGVMFPIVSRRHARNENYKKVFSISFLVTLSISLGVTLVYWILPKLAISILFGNKFLAASNSLVWMAVFIGLLSISYLLVNYFLSINKIKMALFPLVVVPIQVLGIIFAHSSILEIIQVSVVSQLLLFIGLCLRLVYNWAYESS